MCCRLLVPGHPAFRDTGGTPMILFARPQRLARRRAVSTQGAPKIERDHEGDGQSLKQNDCGNSCDHVFRLVWTIHFSHLFELGCRQRAGYQGIRKRAGRRFCRSVVQSGLIRLGITSVPPNSLDKSKHRLVPNRAREPV